MKDVFNVKNLDREIKLAAAKEWVRDKAVKTRDFCYKHADVLMVTLPLGLGLTRAAVKAVSKSRYLREERELKDNYIYDRSAGHYWRLRRKLKPQEWIMIETLRKSGQSYGEILDRMKVLK